MQTKTISLPLEVAERFEAHDETDDDMAELRDRLRRKMPDMIF
jgi:hypothetical protein